MATKDVSREEIEEYKAAFSMFDKDGDGTIDTDELGAVFRSLGELATDEEIEDLVREVDTDGDGVIDFSEFLAMMSKQKLMADDEPDVAREAFNMFDKDGNGQITTDELRQMMKKLGESLTDKEIEMMIEEADVDGDGQINYEEFTKLLLYNK
eukprot:CAMPEP_0197434162 /NCGR_PEP_ID=MMETSP1175-20131217/1931_1 /TAXON_ID=1003142 /ORGANISM="Triceratium dubium, Strain CCMP147" /LENGTH=152 /DNA_ID=CAMNT_0042962781 /DNA_START=114 /DNA_END=572 /DNA_ORIENTATION=+